MVSTSETVKVWSTQPNTSRIFRFQIPGRVNITLLYLILRVGCKYYYLHTFEMAGFHGQYGVDEINIY